jgi:hypothetical protein
MIIYFNIFNPDYIIFNYRLIMDQYRYRYI